MRLRLLLPALLALTLGALPAQASQLTTYQGVLTDGAGNLVPNGNYDITLRVFNVPVGGSVLHDETHIGVPVTKGGFSLLIGSVPGDFGWYNLPFDTDYWLEVQVAPDPTPLSPRVLMTSAPYARMADRVPASSITTLQIRDGEVQSPDIADNTITLAKMVTNSVSSTRIIDDDVRSVDLRDEPGVAFDQDGFATQIVPGGTVTAASVTITTPASGFVLVSYGGNYSDPSHTAGQNGLLLATISEEAGVMGSDATLAMAEVRSSQPSGSISGPPLGKSFVFAKPQGAYTFHMVCRNLGTDEVTIANPVLHAVYFPTAYGTAVGGTPQALAGGSR